MPALCEIQSDNLVFYDLLRRLVLCICTTSANIFQCQENLFLTLKSNLFYSVECILVLQCLCNMLLKWHEMDQALYNCQIQFCQKSKQESIPWTSPLLWTLAVHWEYFFGFQTKAYYICPPRSIGCTVGCRPGLNVLRCSVVLSLIGRAGWGREWAVQCPLI